MAQAEESPENKVLDKDAGPAATPGSAPSTGIGQFAIHPFIWIVGGVKGDFEVNRSGQSKQDRISALSLADFGVRGSYSDWLSFESELMANGGVDFHGTSVFEGQASLQVRKQLIHVQRGRWMAEVGRVIDEASVDYFSEHIADLFLTDTPTRDPLLYSGFNLGNGLRGTVEVVKGLRLGLTLNAGNIVSTSQTLVVGGSFSAFGRVYTQAFASVAGSAQAYPDDSVSTIVATPSVLFETKYVEGRVAGQLYQVNTGVNGAKGVNIYGVNARATVRLHLLNDMISPFASFSFDYNGVVSAKDPSTLQDIKYNGYVFGGGIDFNYQQRFGHNNGVGVQYEQVQNSFGPNTDDTIRFANIGTTYWLAPFLAAGARISFAGDNPHGLKTQGEVSALATMRVAM